MDLYELQAFLSAGVVPDMERIARETRSGNMTPAQAADAIFELASMIKDKIGER